MRSGACWPHDVAGVVGKGDLKMREWLSSATLTCVKLSARRKDAAKVHGLGWGWKLEGLEMGAEGGGGSAPRWG